MNAESTRTHAKAHDDNELPNEEPNEQPNELPNNDTVYVPRIDATHVDERRRPPTAPALKGRDKDVNSLKIRLTPVPPVVLAHEVGKLIHGLLATLVSLTGVVVRGDVVDFRALTNALYYKTGGALDCILYLCVCAAHVCFRSTEAGKQECEQQCTPQACLRRGRSHSSSCSTSRSSSICSTGKPADKPAGSSDLFDTTCQRKQKRSAYPALNAVRQLFTSAFHNISMPHEQYVTWARGGQELLRLGLESGVYDDGSEWRIERIEDLIERLDCSEEGPTVPPPSRKISPMHSKLEEAAGRGDTASSCSRGRSESDSSSASVSSTRSYSSETTVAGAVSDEVHGGVCIDSTAGTGTSMSTDVKTLTETASEVAVCASISSTKSVEPTSGLGSDQGNNGQADQASGRRVEQAASDGAVERVDTAFGVQVRCVKRGTEDPATLHKFGICSPCKHFFSGVCNYGDHCRFCHDPSHEPRGDPAVAHAEGNCVVCSDWFATDCPRGESCLLCHDPSHGVRRGGRRKGAGGSRQRGRGRGGQRGRGRTGGKSKESCGKGGNRTNKFAQRKEIRTTRPRDWVDFHARGICKYCTDHFDDGYCPYGSGCKFCHHPDHLSEVGVSQEEPRPLNVTSTPPTSNANRDTASTTPTAACTSAGTGYGRGGRSIGGGRSVGGSYPSTPLAVLRNNVQSGISGVQYHPDFGHTAVGVHAAAPPARIWVRPNYGVGYGTTHPTTPGARYPVHHRNLIQSCVAAGAASLSALGSHSSGPHETSCRSPRDKCQLSAEARPFDMPRAYEY